MLLSVQDPDGAFRRYTYEDTASTYSAYLACWLAEWGDYFADRAALTGAGRRLDWTVTHRRPNDWIALAGFAEGQHQADEASLHRLCDRGGSNNSRNSRERTGPPDARAAGRR